MSIGPGSELMVCHWSNLARKELTWADYAPAKNARVCIIHSQHDTWERLYCPGISGVSVIKCIRIKHPSEDHSINQRR